MEVTLIIPNYNGKHFLEKCLQSLKKQSVQNFQVIVVDNGSSDESVSYMFEQFPQYKCIALTENTGFCHAVNVGIMAADTPYVILLNNDTIAHKYFVEALVKRIKSSPTIFSVGAQMLQMRNHTLIDDAGDFYTILGHTVARGKDKEAAAYNKVAKVFACCGGAVIYNKSILEKIGLFDEAHFAYLEDVDLGYRARIYGYTNLYEPSAKVLHYGSGSSGSRYNEFKVTLAAANNIYMIYKNMPLLQLFINSPFILVGLFIKYCFFVKQGFGKTYLLGLMKGIKKCSSKEGKIQRVLYKEENRVNYVEIQKELVLNMKYLWSM